MPTPRKKAFFKNSRYFFLTILTICSVAAKQAQAQWRIFQTNKTVHMRAVHAVAPTVCWIGGTKGSILKTTNGGTTWSFYKVPDADSLDFRDIHGFSKDVAVAMSAGLGEQGKARIYRTEDGGETWKLVYQNFQNGVFLDGIDFWDKNRGICLGDPIDGRLFILTTEDGGKTWQELPMASRPEAEPGEACFAASGISIITTGKSDAFIGTGGSKMARIFRSADFGRTWQVTPTELAAGPTSGIFGLHFWSKKNGIAVGGDYKKTADTTDNVLLTTDGGITWKLQESTRPAGLKEGVALYSQRYSNWNGDTPIRKEDEALIAVGPNGNGCSWDGGKTWQILGKENFHAISIAGNIGYAVGANGVIGKLEKLTKKRKKLLGK